MRAAVLVVALLASCAPRVPPPTPDHPASAAAPAGRLAGPPPALRPGVVELSLPAAATAARDPHEGHGAPAAPHAGHDQAAPPATAPPPAAPPVEPAAQPEPAEKRPAKKPAPKRPARKPPPAAPAPAPAPAPAGHDGHQGHGAGS